MTAAVSILAALVGVAVGAVFARRNARSDHADKLLADALNDMVAAIADVAAGDESAQRRYASATSRIALHGSPELIAIFGEWQRHATTLTDDGRARLIAALQASRRELGRPPIDEDTARLLLFGPKRDDLRSLRPPAATG